MVVGRRGGDGTGQLPTRRVFRSDALQHDFDRAGYVVVPVLEEHEVATLLMAFDGLGPISAEAPYHHDLWGHDRGRKDRARLALAPRIDPALGRILHDYRQMTHAFICKQPAEATTVHPHVDISFVDEGRWRSVMAWVSLTGSRAGDGILHIVPGSHRLRGSLRAHLDDASTFPELVDDVVGRWAEAVEVPPGWAVVFDHGIVHYAEPNLGADRTVVAQSVCIPAEAQLRYSVPSGPGRARVHEVDEAFYLGFSLNGSPSEELLAAYPVVDDVSVPTDRLRREQFEGLATRSRSGRG